MAAYDRLLDLGREFHCYTGDCGDFRPPSKVASLRENIGSDKQQVLAQGAALRNTMTVPATRSWPSGSRPSRLLRAED